MNLLKSLIAWAVLIVVLYAAGQVVAAEGWLAGTIFLLVTAFFVGAVVALGDLIASPFKRRRGG